MKKSLVALLLASVVGVTFAQPTLTTEEKNVFMTIASQDIEAMRHGEESIFFPKNGKHYASIVTIEALESIYAKGVDKANEIFTDQWVVLEGTVKNKIPSQAKQQVGFTFKTQRPNQTVVATFSDIEKQGAHIAQAHEGQLVRFVCQSKGKIENELRFQKCQVLAYFADQRQLQVKEAIDQFTNGTTGDEHIDKLIAHVVVLTSLMDEELLALCKDPIGVSQALKKVMVKYNRRSHQLPKAQERLKELKLL